MAYNDPKYMTGASHEIDDIFHDILQIKVGPGVSMTQPWSGVNFPHTTEYRSAMGQDATDQEKKAWKLADARAAKGKKKPEKKGKGIRLSAAINNLAKQSPLSSTYYDIGSGWDVPATKRDGIPIEFYKNRKSRGVKRMVGNGTGEDLTHPHWQVGYGRKGVTKEMVDRERGCKSTYSDLGSFCAPNFTLKKEYQWTRAQNSQANQYFTEEMEAQAIASMESETGA